MSIIALTIVKLCLLILLGWILYRVKAMDEKILKFLSFFVIAISVPCLFFSRLIDGVSAVLANNIFIFLGLSLITFIAGCLAGLLFLFKYKHLRPEILSLLGFQNSGYLPMSMAAFLFTGAVRDEFLVYIILYLLGYNVLLWSMGTFLIFRKDGQKFSFKLLFNPPVISTLIGLAAVYCGIAKYVPSVILDPIRMLGDMTFVLSMIVLGGCLAELDQHDFWRNMRLSMHVSIVKLVTLPAVFVAIIWYWRIYSLLGLFLVLQTAMPSAVTIPIAVDAQSKTADKSFISQVIFISHLISIVTIPVWLFLFSYLSGMKF